MDGNRTMIALASHVARSGHSTHQLIRYLLCLAIHPTADALVIDIRCDRQTAPRRVCRRKREFPSAGSRECARRSLAARTMVLNRLDSLPSQTAPCAHDQNTWLPASVDVGGQTGGVYPGRCLRMLLNHGANPMWIEGSYTSCLCRGELPLQPYPSDMRSRDRMEPAWRMTCRQWIHRGNQGSAVPVHWLTPR